MALQHSLAFSLSFLALLNVCFISRLFADISLNYSSPKMHKDAPPLHLQLLLLLQLRQLFLLSRQQERRERISDGLRYCSGDIFSSSPILSNADWQTGRLANKANSVLSNRSLHVYRHYDGDL